MKTILLFLILLTSCKISETSFNNKIVKTDTAKISKNIMEEDILLKELRQEIIKSFCNTDKNCYLP